MKMSKAYWEALQDFGRLVESYRKRKGHAMTRREMGAYCGISHSTLSLIEKGKAPPSEEVFGYMTELFQWNEKKTRETLPKLRAARGAPKGKRDEIVDRWLAGRRVFRDTLDRWRASADLSKDKLAEIAGLSRVVMTQIFNLTYAIPRNGVCRRLAKACGKKPLRLLLLRFISVADPALRRGLVELFFPDEKELLKEMKREEIHGIVPIELRVSWKT